MTFFFTKENKNKQKSQISDEPFNCFFSFNVVFNNAFYEGHGIALIVIFMLETKVS